jgi:hypothetical protein
VGGQRATIKKVKDRLREDRPYLLLPSLPNDKQGKALTRDTAGRDRLRQSYQLHAGGVQMLKWA